MNTRLQQFLELEELTPAKFADLMGLQRSGISHLLSGRNKPGYDFITKFLKRFPQINAEWFLLGVGKPYKAYSTDTPSSSPHSTQPKTGTSIFPTTTDIGHLFSETIPSESYFPEEGPDLSAASQGNRDMNVENQTSITPNMAQECAPRQISPKRIGRITVFYTDGSFDEFFPR